MYMMSITSTIRRCARARAGRGARAAGTDDGPGPSAACSVYRAPKLETSEALRPSLCAAVAGSSTARTLNMASASALLALAFSVTFVAVHAAPAHLIPRWTPTWELAASTIIQPCNDSGLMDSSWLAKWGVVSMDWSNGRAAWAQQQPMDCDGMLLEQARSVKEIDPSTHFWVYRNIVKALPWFSNVREKLEDPQYQGWFLPFKDGTNGTYAHGPGASGNIVGPGGQWHKVTACTPGQGCSDRYHDQWSSPQCNTSTSLPPNHRFGWCNETCDCGKVPCGEYVFDHRNSSLSDWLVQEFLLGATGLGSEFVDGYFLDDGWDAWAPGQHGSWGCNGNAVGGPTEMTVNCTADMGLGSAELKDITNQWHTNMITAKAVAVAAKGFSWQLLLTASTPIKGAQCEAFFRRACAPHSQEYDSALMVPFAPEGGKSPDGRAPNFLADLATFLLIRGPHAWIGHPFVGCSLWDQKVGGPGQLYERPLLLDTLKVGTPLDTQCQETAAGSGVFARQWTGAHVSFDCATATGSVNATSPPPTGTQ